MTASTKRHEKPNGPEKQKVPIKGGSLETG